LRIITHCCCKFCHAPNPPTSQSATGDGLLKGRRNQNDHRHAAAHQTVRFTLMSMRGIDRSDCESA
jgi:hypothetical protein